MIRWSDVYSMRIALADTRRRALAAYERGEKTQPEIAAIFGITVRTFQRWWRAWRTEGRDAPGHSPGRPRTIVGKAEHRLRQEVANQPDATLHELAERLGHIASYVTIHRTLEQWNLPLKKRRCEPRSKTGRT
jgi:transposase